MDCLVFLNGDEPGKTVSLQCGPKGLRMGREPDCEIVLEGEQISRVHAQIIPDDDSWRIEDCGSLNGTHVNSHPVERSILQPGDIIRIGEFTLVFSKQKPSEDGFNPVLLADDTRVRRLSGAEKRRIAEDPIGADSTSGPLRKLAFLYRLSREMYRTDSLDSLLRYALQAISDVIGSASGRICIRGIGNRLRTYGHGTKERAHDTEHILTSWVLEKDEALLLDLNEEIPLRSPNESVERGTAVGAPIPGRTEPRGVIACFNPEGERLFEVGDLEFLVSVAQQIGLAVENLEQRERVIQSNEQLRIQLNESRSTFLGECNAIRDLRRQIARVASTNVTVLVVGESGTGKEVTSQMIHDFSERNEGPFVAVNCAAFSESLLDSELFGHEKGAFTGADTRRQGQFERAHQGTIFLDEVGELSANCQAKLLRLLEGKPFDRLGGSDPVSVDVRIVAATHRDLGKMVRQGKFREDLSYRLRVVELRVPALRDRGDDIVDLAEHFLERLRSEMGYGPTRLSKSSVKTLLNYEWPGNVRELKNAIERALVLCNGDEIRPADLGITAQPTAGLMAVGDVLSLVELEARHIQQVLELVEGNKTKACELLGIPRASLYNKLKRLELA